MINITEEKTLELLSRECGEVMQACSNALKFGLDGIDPELGITYRRHLEVELGDVAAMLGILIERQTVSPMELAKNELKKIRRMEETLNDR